MKIPPVIDETPTELKGEVSTDTPTPDAQSQSSEKKPDTHVIPKFSEADAVYDKPGIETLEKLMRICNLTYIRFPKGMYGIDLRVYDSDSNYPLFDIDAEVRPLWTEKIFVYDRIHVPYRKGHIEYPNATFFATISANLQWVKIVNVADLVGTEEAVNRRSPDKKETFYYYSQFKRKHFNFDLNLHFDCKIEMKRLLARISNGTWGPELEFRSN